MNLVCESKVKTNLIISIYYIVVGIAGLFLFPMPDRIGRKKTMLINVGVHLAAQYLIIFVPVYKARLIGFILLGVSQIKNGVAYVYVVELVPPRQSGPVNVCLTSFDSATMFVVCFYFIFISKDWFPLIFTMTALATLAYLGIVFLLPESPIWLLKHGRVEDAIAAFNWIAKVNGSKNRIPDDAIFKEVASEVDKIDIDESQGPETSPLADAQRSPTNDYELQQSPRSGQAGGDLSNNYSNDDI